MTERIEPTKTAFDSAEQITLDVISEAAPSAMTKTGSVVRELIIRPLSYMFAWMTANLENARRISSIAHLKTSQATVNEVADLVASNYFVTRRAGTRAKGMLTLTLNTPVSRIAQGASFRVGDVVLVVPTQIVITNTDANDPQAGITYIKAVALGDSFVANIPVVARNVGRIEVSPGGTVIAEFASSVIELVELTSAITGGDGIETDADLMRRAEYNTAESGIGTFNGLRKKFATAPIDVKGMSVVAGEDLPLFRARYNNVNINPGGFVDVYVKTQIQSSLIGLDRVAVKRAAQSPSATTTIYDIEVYDDQCAGFFGVSSVIVDGGPVDSFSVTFGSADSITPAEGARLSADQTAIVSFESLTDVASMPARVYVSYLPGVLQLQHFIDGDEERFIGQDIKVKAAVPAMLSIDCAVSSASRLSTTEMTLLKRTIANYINSLNVGYRSVNFSDIRKCCAVALPGADLRLPCTVSASILLQDGSSDTSHSCTGIFDLGVQTNKGYWSSLMCFFATTEDSIRIVQI